jgi:DNA polymerase-1
MTKRMILVDGSSLMYRSFFALKNFKTSQGIPTNAIYGYTSIILKIRKQDLEYGAIIFDSPVKTFRHKKFEEYKSNRKKMPEELSLQIPYIKEISKLLGFNLLEVEEYEADDVIGTICEKIKYKNDIEALIISGDLDVLQLVNSNIKVMLTQKGVSKTVIYDSEKIYERYGLKPSQIVDFKALKGDPSDNIPGVPGIGEKIALKLLKEYGTLENIFNNLEKIEGKEKELLKNGKDIAIISKFLATIKNDIPLEIEIEDLKIKKIDEENLKDLLNKLEFKTILERIKKEAEQLKIC